MGNVVFGGQRFNRKFFIRDKETNFMLAEFVVSKVLEVLFYEIVGESLAEKIKRKIGLDKLSRIGKKALHRTINENEDNLIVLMKIREIQNFDLRDPSDINKKGIYDNISEKVDKKKFDKFFKSLEGNYYDILFEEADKKPEIKAVLISIRKLENEIAKENFSKVFWSKTILFFYCSLFVISLFLCLFFLRTTLNDPNIYQESIRSMLSARNYILSSISQGLAAIFAIVFTITLVMAQISSRYSIRITNIVFSRTTLFMMCLYAVGIIIPLLVMRSQSEKLLYLCIIWAVVCILLLIPYFLYLKERLNLKYYIKYLLEEINQDYVKKLKKIHQERLSEEYPMYSLDRSGGKYWFNIPDDPLLAVLGILTKILREGDYETFIYFLKSVKEKYYLTVNKTNVDYLAFHFVNIFDRSGEIIIDEKRDFLLLQLCFTLKDIATFNVNEKFHNINARISDLIIEYLELALTQKEFSDVIRDIEKTIRKMSSEYAKSELDFSNLVSRLFETIQTQRIKETGKIFYFLNFIGILAMTAIQHRLHLRYWAGLISCIKEIGIESAKGRLKIRSLPEKRISKWAWITLRNIKNQVEQYKEYFDQIKQDRESSELFSSIEKSMSDIEEAQGTYNDLAPT